MKKLNLLGKKWANLEVIGPAPKNKAGRNTWECKCICGKIIILRATTIHREVTSSCGCINSKNNNMSIKPGDKFGRLTAIKYAGKRRWICECECGIVKQYGTQNLTRGGTVSCGCYRKENGKNKIDALINAATKFPINISVGRKIWRNRYSDGNITFEEFHLLSQQNCFYCGTIPFAVNTKKPSKYSKYTEEESKYIYNGLDRVDSSLPHDFSNCVTSCLDCNRAKSDLSLEDFIKKFNRIKRKDDFTNLITIEKDLPENNYAITNIKFVFRSYDDGDLNINEFYYWSQLPCYYCGTELSNCSHAQGIDKKASEIAKELGPFHYNGLDRIDSNLGHIKGNIVTSCHDCNWAKMEYSINYFYDWAERFQANLKVIKNIETDNEYLIRIKNILNQ